MSKVLKEAAVTTRNARARLPAGVHWRAIDPDTHLGYRKAVRGGRWMVRWYSQAGAYKQATLATADDSFDADGTDILDFGQASIRARAFVKKAKADARAEAAGPAVTVRSAVDSYVEAREARERSQHTGKGMRRDARSRLAKHVLSTDLADRPLHKLTEEHLSKWLAGRKGLAPASVRRLVNDLKAALNAAARTHRAKLPPDLPAIVKAGLRHEESHAPEARKQILSDADVRALIAAAWLVDGREGLEGDYARVVVVLAATGARLSQIARMVVADAQVDECRLMVPTSHKGRGVKNRTQTGIRIGEDVIAVLKPVIAGRRGTEPLLERWRHRQVKGAQWERDRRGAWHSSSEFSRPWAATVAEAGLSSETVPYALRHSSIVRGLRAGLPVRLVAAIHDTSSAMIERHYAAYVVDALDELSARAVIPLTTTPAQVIALPTANKRA